MIDDLKHNCYSRLANKLLNVQRNSKPYWSMLKTFLNNKKVPSFPPLFHENEFVTDFKKKAGLFNSFFAKQCSLISNDSKLPSQLHYFTEKRLSAIKFSSNNIFDIIQQLDPNKAHSHDMISIRMLKICGKSICRRLELIFKECISNGVFPSEWNKGNLVPIHNKNDRQCLENYRPVSLLPISGKILECLIFNEMFPFFIKNGLISQNQLGFKPGDSCVNQLLSITHEIYKSFDDGFDVRSVFLDISKAFDKVWHESIIFKLKQNSISGELLNLLCDFLRNRKQRVVLNGQVST